MPLDLRAFIKKHLVYHEPVEYSKTGTELLELVELAKTTLCRETEANALIEVPTPVKIVGDLHGAFFDLQRYFFAIGMPGKHRYLFLGDYVDRGQNSVECIALLLAYKLLLPNRIFLLRGNHECAFINLTYGFWDELARRFTIETATKLYGEFNTIFSYLPFAALIRGKILCMHGGISPKLRTMDDIRRIKLPIETPAAGSLEQDLLWSDPSMDISGFGPNQLRGVSVVFGEDEVKKLCTANGIDLIVRAHQVMANGYGLFFNRKLVTVFSAPRYQPDLNNKGALMIIDKDMRISFVILNPVDSANKGGKENFERTFKTNVSAGFSESIGSQ